MFGNFDFLPYRAYLHAIQTESPFGKWIAVIWAIVSAISAFKTEALSPETQERLQYVHMIPELSLGTWVAITWMLLFFWAVVASFRYHRKVAALAASAEQALVAKGAVQELETRKLLHELAELKTQQRPKLHIHFDSEDDKCVRRQPTAVYFCALPIVISRKHLKGCKGYLTHIETQGGANNWEPSPFGTRLQLRWQDQRPPKDGFDPEILHAGHISKQYLDMFHVVDGQRSEISINGEITIQRLSEIAIEKLVAKETVILINVSDRVRLHIAVVAEEEADEGARANFVVEIEKTVEWWNPKVHLI